MKWLGQHIVDFIARFKSDVHIDGSIKAGENGLGNLEIQARDVFIKNDEVDSSSDTTTGDPTFRIGSSETECFRYTSNYQTGTKSMQLAVFSTLTESATANDGRFRFVVDGSQILEIDDGGIDFVSGFAGGISFNGVDILTDNGSGETTLSNIDAIDSATTATLTSALSAGDITSVVAGTGMTGGATSGDATVNVIGGNGITANSDDMAITSSQTTIESIYNDNLKVGRDEHNLIDFATTDDKIFVRVADANQLVILDGGILPVTTNDIDLGSAAREFKDAYFDGIVTSDSFVGNLTGQAQSVSTIAGLAPNTATTQATQPNITTLAGVSAIGTAGTPIVITSDEVTFSSANADDPIVTIKNTSNSPNDMASLKFVKDRGAAPAIGDNLAEIYFIGEDADQNSQEYGRILCETDVVTDGQESGVLKFGVANHDGGNGYGLILTGGSADNEVDVTLGLGAASVVTIPGGLSLGTDLPTDQQKHLAWFILKGYGTGDGTNYEIPEIVSDNNAPFEHNTSTGSDGLTAQTVQTMMRLGGLVAPRAGTLKKWYGWATTAGSQTANIGLFRVRPTRNDNTNLTPVLLDNVSYTAIGNTKMEDFDETSFTDADIAVGDVIYTGIKCQSGKVTYFTSTLEIEWD